MVFFNKKQFNQDQLKILAIISKWLEDKEATVMMSEVDYYISNPDKSVHVFISDGSIQFATADYFVKDSQPIILTDKIKRAVEQRKIRDIEDLKKKVSLNKGSLLSAIYNEK